jgi:hypothetical protein
MDLEQLQQIFPGATADTWHQHPNGGGWVQNTAKVYETAWVGKDAVVYGDAVVLWNSSISGNARVLADGYGSGGEEMTLEKALERNQFLQKALDEAIDLAQIRTWDLGYIVAGYGGDNATYDVREPQRAFPALVEYLEGKE